MQFWSHYDELDEENVNEESSTNALVPFYEIISPNKTILAFSYLNDYFVANVSLPSFEVIELLQEGFLVFVLSCNLYNIRS